MWYCHIQCSYSFPIPTKTLFLIYISICFLFFDQGIVPFEIFYLTHTHTHRYIYIYISNVTTCWGFKLLCWHFNNTIFSRKFHVYAYINARYFCMLYFRILGWLFTSILFKGRHPPSHSLPLWPSANDFCYIS